MAFKTAEDAAAVAICCSGILLSVPPVLCRTQQGFFVLGHIYIFGTNFGSALTGHEIQDLLTIRLPSAPKLKLSE